LRTAVRFNTFSQHLCALDNQNTCSFDKLVDKEKTPCQNSDNPIDDIKENSMIDNQRLATERTNYKKTAQI